MQQSRKPSPSKLASLVVALAAIMTGLHPARAEDALSPGGMQIFLTPYLWLSGINATTQTPLAREPQVNSDVSAIDLLSHLSGVPFMGSAEIRDGPFGLLGDVLHVPVSTTIRTRDVLFQGGKAALRQTQARHYSSTAHWRSPCSSRISAAASARGASRRT